MSVTCITITHDLPARNNSGAIPEQEYQELEAMLRSLFAHPQLMRRWMGEYLSSSRHDLDIISAEPPWQNSETYQFLEEGETMKRLGGLRAFYFPQQPHILYINGDRYELPEECGHAATYLCDEERISREMLGKQLDHPAFIALLTQLVNMGYWYPVE